MVFGNNTVRHPDVANDQAKRTGEKKAAVKAKLANMTVAEKLPYAITGIKKKLLLDPTNAELQKKLKLYEKKLAELTAAKT